MPPDHGLRHTVAVLPPNLVRAALLLVALPIIGTLAYMVLEGFSFIDALYMTMITLTTVGYREVEPLDTSGKILTMIIAVVGVGAIFYALISLFQFLLEGELGTLLGVRRMKGQIEKLRGHYILCGFGRVGSQIAREFAERRVPFVIVESNADTIQDAADEGYLVVQGDATTDAALKEAGIDRAWAILAASDSDSGNTFIVLTAKALRPDIYVVARAGRGESDARMRRAGADRVFSPYIIAGRQMAISAMQPVVSEFIDTLGPHVAGAPVLAEIDVSEGSGLSGRSVAEILHGCKSVVVLGLQKESGALTVGPPLTTALEQGDRIIVMGQEDELESIRPAGGRANLAHAPRGTA